MKCLKSNLLLLIITISLIAFYPVQEKKLQIHLEHSTLNKTNKITFQIDLYYLIDEGKIISHYTIPEELIYVYTNTGETKIYSPKTNEVKLMQNELFKSQYNILSLFVNNQTENFGLNNIGLAKQKTEFENNLVISTWTPVITNKENYSEVKMVHEDYLPIFIEYKNNENKTIKKEYYSDYKFFDDFLLPMRITEINYLPNGDSIITRQIYSDLKKGVQAESQYFNFKIPDNAIIKN